MLQSMPCEVDHDPAELVCPSCGGAHLHHERVDIYSRAADAPTGVHAAIANEQVTIDGDLRHNPSRRRDGLRIAFWCETCEAKPRLDIVQHKGVTLLQWANGSEIPARRLGE